jgi:electron transfer flavoprotein beta subunit
VALAADGAADAPLREALACGADAVLQVVGPDPAGSPAEDGDGAAGTLLRAIRDHHGEPDVVVFGERPADPVATAVPAFLAARLGAAQALGLVSLGVAADATTVLRAVRRLDGGRRERLALPLPAVCSVEADAARLRRAALPALLAARGARVPVATAGPGDTAGSRRVQAGPPRPHRPRPRVLPAPQDPDPRRRVLALTGELLGDRTARRVVTPADPAAAVDALLGYLHRHGYLEGDPS